MKHATVSPSGRIVRLADEPSADTFEITDEQAALVQAGKLASPRIWYVILEGVFTPRADVQAQATVPTQITAWQAKAALALTPHPTAGNLRNAAEAALAGMPEGTEKVVALSAWENNANFERQSTTIAAIAEAIGISSQEVDSLFQLGDGLVV